MEAEYNGGRLVTSKPYIDTVVSAPETGRDDLMDGWEANGHGTCPDCNIVRALNGACEC
jgi:hypothetical protein